MNEKNKKAEPFQWRLNQEANDDLLDAAYALRYDPTDTYETKMDAIFEHDKKHGYITINATYPYHIELNRIPDPEGLVHWLDHLMGKHWMTSDLVREFIRRVYAIKGWDLYKRDL